MSWSIEEFPDWGGVVDSCIFILHLCLLPHATNGRFGASSSAL
jgi:hypothetical protein